MSHSAQIEIAEHRQHGVTIVTVNPLDFDLCSSLRNDGLLGDLKL